MPRDRACQAFTSHSAEDLLGPLNDVETKFAPPRLFIAGSMEISIPRPRVAIVGSHNASAKGPNTTAEIAKALSKKKRVIIVSGLVKGIDTKAHKSAIEAGGHARPVPTSTN